MQTLNLEELISIQEAQYHQEDNSLELFGMHWNYIMDHIENYLSRTEYITLFDLETLCLKKGSLCGSTYPMYQKICQIYLELWAAFSAVKVGDYQPKLAMQAMQVLCCLDKLLQRETGKNRYEYANSPLSGRSN